MKTGSALALSLLIAACTPTENGATDAGAIAPPPAGPPPPPPPPPPRPASDAQPALDPDAAPAPAPDAALAPDAGVATSPDASPAADAAPALDPDAGPPATNLYAADGPDSYSTMSFSLDNNGRTFTEVVYLPSSPGPHPVIVLGPGTQQPVTSYEIFIRRFTSYGFIVVGRDDPGPLARTPRLVEDLIYAVTTWLPAQNADSSSWLYNQVDLTRVGLIGHSRGGKATLMAAEGGLRGVARAYFALDMVDVTFIDDGVYAMTDIANVGIPTAYVVAEVPSNCSPAAYSGEAMYGGSPSPSLMIVALAAGHTDFAEPCVACGICSPDGTADPASVRAFSARYAMAFFARELLQDARVGAELEGAGSADDEAAGTIRVESK